MRIAQYLNRALTALSLATLAACVSYPTEKSSVVDTRPHIAFRMLDGADADARVLIDDLDMGRTGDFAVGKSALRVRPGTHQLTVRSRGQIIVSEKFYVADGVSRTFDLKEPAQ